ncbi:hypothetical protein P12x_002289 [Tundrisphaera lichenicola]|uniref:hypothetical protein n=1 Tax=Tundrisphaera lichenicola TaxID=2029860 RepID=UPI003EBE80AE
MDNESSGINGPGRKIALGLTAYLRPFAARRGAETWWQFASGNLADWKYYLLEVVDDPGTTVYFNLHGVNVGKGLARAVTPRYSPTDWELLQIREHEIWWPRVEWWDEDIRTSNPFEQEPES